MDNSNKDFNHDGDWEERSDQFWNEFDWMRFLERHDQEVARFTELYLANINHPNHLDVVAHQMGWDADEWSSAEFANDDAVHANQDEDEDDNDPYTLHRHPVYVVTRSLCRQLSDLWVAHSTQLQPSASSASVWLYARALASLEHNLTLGVQSLDMADFALSIAQLKLALKCVNDCFAALDNLTVDNSPGVQHFLGESRHRLFDLRELALRVINDCRIEMSQTGGSDNDADELD